MASEEQYIEVIKKQDEFIANLYQYVSQHNYHDVVAMIDRFLFPDDPIYPIQEENK